MKKCTFWERQERRHRRVSIFIGYEPGADEEHEMQVEERELAEDLADPPCNACDACRADELAHVDPSEVA